MNIWKNIFDRLVKSSQVQKCFKYIAHKHSFLHSGCFFFSFSDISYYIILIQRIVATIRMHNEKSIEKYVHVEEVRKKRNINIFSGNINSLAIILSHV